MRKLQVSLLVLVASIALWPSESFGGLLFRRSARRANGSSTSTTTATPIARVSSEQVATAQGVAELMAQYNRVGHFGGNPGYEGCGSGSTQQAAYNACCYSRSGMRTVDVGYAKGSNGVWYCCRRYQ
jgi:hypothetical protein